MFAWMASETFLQVSQLAQGQGPGDDLSLSPAMTLAHRHPSQSDLLSLRLSLVLQGRLLLAQIGHWAQPRCLLLELGLEQLLCLPGKPRQTLQLWQRRCQSGGL